MSSWNELEFLTEFPNANKGSIQRWSAIQSMVSYFLCLFGYHRFFD